MRRFLTLLFLGVLTCAPIAIYGQKTGAGGGFGGSASAGQELAALTYKASDYGSLSAAVSAIGSTNSAKLLISTPTAAFTGTISRNITLVFSQTGTLTFANGVVLDHYGGIEAPPHRQIFVRTGTGRIIFGGADATNGATQSQMNPASGAFQIPALYPQWWGVVGDFRFGVSSTDDTAALQAMLNVIPNYATVIFTPNLKMKITAGLVLNNRRGVRLVGVGNVGEAGASDALASFNYAGTDTGVVMLALGRCRNCVFENLLFYCAGATGNPPADVGVYLDNVGGTSGDISSANQFISVSIYSGALNASFVGFQVGNTASGENDEYHQFIRCTIIACLSDNVNATQYGTCILLAHGNVKQIVIRDCTLLQAQYCIRSDGGSFLGYGNRPGYSQVGYFLNSWTDRIVIDGDDSEGLVQLLKTTQGLGGSAPVVISSGRYDRQQTVNNVGTSSNPFIDNRTGGNLTIRNNFLGGWYHTSNNTWFTTSNVLIAGANTGGMVIYDQNVLNDFATNLYLYANLATNYLAIVDGQIVIPNPTYNASDGNYSSLSTGLLRHTIGVQANSTDASVSGAQPATVNNLYLDDGKLEIGGLARPARPTVRRFGTSGATLYKLAVIAKDSGGRRTLRSLDVQVTLANATLSGSNYLAVQWAAVPSAASYDLIQIDNANSAKYRVITNTASTSYDIQANPSGSFSLDVPTYNETGVIYRRGQVVDAIALTFTDGDTTPSTATTNQFTASNTGTTTITNFDDGINGQTILILFTNANTTIQHNSTIKTRSGADLTPAMNTMYSFTRRGGIWYQN